MPRKSLHGNAPDQCVVALLLIDVINDLNFDGNKGLLQTVSKLKNSLCRLKQRARNAGVPVVYVNDNFGRWRSDFKAQFSHCLESNAPGKALAEKLKPEDADYFVLKPKHSGFYSTTLNLLLHNLGAEILVLAGVAGDKCVLFTANDAFLRDYKIVVVSDCVASNSVAENKQALKLMKRVLNAEVCPVSKIDFVALKRKRRN